MLGAAATVGGTLGVVDGARLGADIFVDFVGLGDLFDVLGDFDVLGYFGDLDILGILFFFSDIRLGTGAVAAQQYLLVEVRLRTKRRNRCAYNILKCLTLSETVLMFCVPNFLILIFAGNRSRS
jgi:hypothetical protein